MALPSIETKTGQLIKVEVVEGEVILNGTVRLLVTDIEADNGIIHVIDGVLLPPAEGEETAEEAGEEGQVECPENSISGIAKNNDDFSTLAAALDAQPG